jgi:Flp pilus assembly protein TadG
MENQKGVALIELAIVMFCLCVLTFGGIAMSYQLRTQVYALNGAGGQPSFFIEHASL